MAKVLMEAPDRRNKAQPDIPMEKRSSVNDLAQLFSELLVIKTDLDQFRNEVGQVIQLKTKLGLIEDRLRDFSQRINTVSTTLNDNINAQSSKLESLEGSIKSLETNGSHGSNDGEVKQKLDELKSNLTFLLNEESNIRKAIASDHEKNTDSRLGVQEQDLDMGGHKILNVEGSEVATKEFVNEGLMRAIAASGRGGQGGGGIGRKGRPNDGEYARWNRDRLEGRTIAEVVADLSYVPVVEKTSDYTATSSDAAIIVDCTSNDVTITLPAVADNDDKIYYIKRIDGSVYSLYIDGNGSETIDGETSIQIISQYTCVMIVAGTTEWHILASA